MTEGRKDAAIILGIIMLTLCINTVYFAQLRHTSVFPAAEYSDAFYYYRWAQDIASGDLLGDTAFMKWPLYAYFLATLFRVAGDYIPFVYLVQSLLSAFTFALVYLIGRRLWSRPVGVAAVVACLSYAMFVFYNGLMIYTTLALFLNTLLCYLLIRVRSAPSAGKLFGCGVLAGFCMLTQGNSVFFSVPAALWIVMERVLPRQRRAAWLVSFLAGAALIAGSVTARNYLVSRDFVPVAANTGINFYIGNNPQADGMFFCPSNIACNQEGMFRDSKALARLMSGKQLKPSGVSGYWFAQGFQFIAARPVDAVKLYLAKLRVLFNINEPAHDLEYPHIKEKVRLWDFLIPDLRFILPFGLLGIWINRRRLREHAVLYAASAAFSLSLLPFFITSRYRILCVPFMALFAGSCVVSLWQDIRLRNMRRIGSCVVLLLVVYVGAGRLFPQDTPARRMQQKVGEVQAYLDAALKEMKAHDGASAVRYARQAHEVNPHHYAGLLVEGYIHNKLGNQPESERVLQEVIAKFPYCVRAYRMLGELYESQGRRQEARELLMRAAMLEE